MFLGTRDHSVEALVTALLNYLVGYLVGSGYKKRVYVSPLIVAMESKIEFSDIRAFGCHMI